MDVGAGMEVWGLAARDLVGVKLLVEYATSPAELEEKKGVGKEA